MLKTLQAGRAIAALSVAAFHLSILLGQARYGGHATFELFTRRGNLGVDYFFVLSGFIILHAHAGDIGRPAALGDYLRKRFVRVFPIYWLYTAGFAALVLLGIGTAAAVPETAAGWAQTVTLIRLTAEATPLPPAWTLFHEIAFYGLFALLIWRPRLGIAALAVWGLIGLALLHYPADTDRTPVAVYTAAYNLNFLLGMGAYLAWRRANLSQSRILLAAGAVLLSGTLAFEYFGATWPIRGLLYALAFAGIMAGLAGIEAAGRIKVPRWLQLLGDASYTTYLIHAPLQGLFAKVLLKVGADALIGPEATYLLILALTLGAALGAYLLLEKPLLRLLRSRLGTNREPTRAPAEVHAT